MRKSTRFVAVVVIGLVVATSGCLTTPKSPYRETRASPVAKPPMPRELKTYMQVIMESIEGFEALLDKRYEFETREECLAVYEDQYAPLLLKAAAMYYGSKGTAFSPEDVGEGVPNEAIAIHENLLATYESFGTTLGDLCLQVYNDSRGLEAIVGPNPSAAERRWWETRYDSIDANWLLTIASLEEIKTELNDLFSPYEEGELFSAFVQSGTTRPTWAETATAPIPTPTWPTKTAEGDPAKGSAYAPVTIIEYTEFQCPFCARFVKETLPLVEENYIATEKVRLIFRNFPLHEEAVLAAGAGVCAQQQDKFWQMHDTLFTQQGEWSENPDFIEFFQRYAQDIGLDTDQFSSCLNAGAWLDKVKKDFEAGQEAGVEGTPSFFINDQVIVGAQRFQIFQEVIEQELAK